MPTEDPERVAEAIANIFPDLEIERVEGGLFAHGEGFEAFKDGIRKARMLDAAHAEMVRGMQGDRTRFLLHKQAAYVGRIGFVAERSDIGSMEVVFESSDIEGLIDELAPRTVNGEVP